MNFNSAGTTNPLLFGLSAGAPASSIAALRTNGITTDGAYWFSTTKQATPFQAYVKFNYIDGGDWALLLKVHNQGDLPSGSPFWTNATLSNSTDFNLTSGTWSKYATWNGIEFTRLMYELYTQPTYVISVAPRSNFIDTAVPASATFNPF